jgi:hypothetical protein
LICSFYVRLNNLDEPLSDGLDTPVSIHAAHVGLYTFLKRASFVVEDDWYLEDIRFRADCRSEM